MSTFRTSLLQERWSWIEAQRGEIATELHRLSSELPSQDRKMLRRLARWFSGNAGFEKAIKRPDVLAVCVPLAQSNIGDKFSQTEIKRAVRTGFCSIGRTLSVRGRLVSLFLYPALLVALMAVLAIFFSVSIIPLFQSIFEDFGIELPKLTRALFKLAWLVRSGWTYAFWYLAGFAGLALAMNLVTSRRRISGESWLDERLKTNRNRAAGWAWHMAMLLDSGISQTHAVEIAGNSQHSNWLKRACQTWISHQQAGSQDSERSPLFGHRYQLLETTLGVASPDAQVDLFKEIATYYWARNRNIGDWWIQWAASILFWIFAAVVVLVVFALYSPMLAIISGLTGGTVSGISG